MDIFQRRWEMTRREYLELLNDWLRIDRTYLEAVAEHEGDPIYEIEKMLRRGFTTEMVAHAFEMSVYAVEDVLTAMQKQRDDLSEWHVKAEAFEKAHGKPVLSDNTRHFYRVEREYSYRGPGDYILSDKPFDEDAYSLFPDFPHEQTRYGF